MEGGRGRSNGDNNDNDGGGDDDDSLTTQFHPLLDVPGPISTCRACWMQRSIPRGSLGLPWASNGRAPASGATAQ